MNEYRDVKMNIFTLYLVNYFKIKNAVLLS